MHELDFAQVLASYANAARERDIDSMMALYDNDITAFDCWDAWSIEGEAQWRSMNSEWFNSLGTETVQIGFDSLATRQSGKLAAAEATITFTAISASGERLRSMQNRLTWVFEHGDRGWKIVHQHSSVPINAANMKAIINR